MSVINLRHVPRYCALKMGVFVDEAEKREDVSPVGDAADGSTRDVL
jgi:hypothetical protein